MINLFNSIQNIGLKTLKRLNKSSDNLYNITYNAHYMLHIYNNTYLTFI